MKLKKEMKLMKLKKEKVKFKNVFLSQDHKSSVMAVQWNSNGNWLLTGGRDHLIKLYDIRIMKEMHTFRGHKKEVTCKLYLNA